MQLARSRWLKGLVVTIAAAVFVWLLEARILDSKDSMLSTVFRGFIPASAPDALGPGARATFTATAYCKGPVTRAGVAPRAGVAASDPALLPLGSIVQLDVEADRYDGIYSVLDTGPEVSGRELDIYIWSCTEALQFGRRPVQLTVLRHGWSPTATVPLTPEPTPEPTLLQRLFGRPGS